ncbi:MAG TPA: hypothetical protein VGX68_13675 [Thermoanaerobaculia bacterium]|jgi:hypothetical protein|nr:hypothetical protein [Thermoanaerobaculia bacterium]
MMQLILHPTPRGRDAVLEQVRIVGLGLRREALIAAVVLGIVTLAIGIVRGGAGIHFDADASFPTSVVGFLFPFAIWRGERRFGPAFLWTLPVDRRRLAFAKVFAGWVWLMAALAVFVLWLLALAHLSAATGVRTVTLFPFTGATALYLLGSALVLGLRHPLRWLLGTMGMFFLLVILSDAVGRTENGELRMVAWSGLLRSAVYGPYGLDTLLSSSGFVSAAEHAAAAWRALPDLAQWATATLLWLGAGLAALWAAASRHGERRRH